MRTLFLFALFFTLLDASSYRSFQAYSAQGVDANLLNIPGFVITANIPFEPTYLYAVGAEFGFYTFQFENQSTLITAITPVLAKHYGLQEHIEADVALTIKYMEVFFSRSMINSNIAYGQGFSYAFGTPYYEVPVPSEDNPNGYYRLQSYLHLDIELYIKQYSEFALLFRVHHRSGIYGIVAPPKVGSNFLSLGISYTY